MGAIGCTGGIGDGALWRLRSLRTLASCSSRESIDIKVLKDLGLLFQPRIYRHSGPNGPVAIGSCMARDSYPGHPDNPGHPASDKRDIKVLKDLDLLFLMNL